MSLDINKESYVTLDEANEIASKNYTSTSDILVKWNALSDSDKEVLLRNSCTSIDCLKFDGVKARANQSLAFPRKLSNPVGIGYALFISQMYDNSLYSRDDQDGGLLAVKKAQVENALWACYLGEAVTKQAGVNMQGLTSKKAGPIAETYNTNNRYTKNALRGIYTDKVYSLLVDWLCDSRATI